MPSLKKVTTITSSSSEDHFDGKVIAEVIERSDKISNIGNPTLVGTKNSKPDNIMPQTSATPKSNSKANKKEIAPNQRTIGSFFTTMKPKEKSRSSPSSSPIESDTKMLPQLTDSDTPSEVIAAASIAITPSTSSKKERCGDSVLNVSEDIMAIVLGSHCVESNASSTITPLTKPRSKFGGVSVDALLPPLVVQGLQTAVPDGNSTSTSERVKSSSILQTLGASEVKVKAPESSSPTQIEEVNFLKPRSKKDPIKRKADLTKDKSTSETTNATCSAEFKSTSTFDHCASVLGGDSIEQTKAKDVVVCEKQKVLGSAGPRKYDVEKIISSEEVENDKMKECNESNNTSDVTPSCDDKKSDEEDIPPVIINPIDATPTKDETSCVISPEDSALLVKYESMKLRYLARGHELVKRAKDISLDEEPFQKDAREGLINFSIESESLKTPSTVEFSNDWLNTLSLLVQGSPLPIDDLAKVAAFKINSELASAGNFVSFDTVATKIKLIATRTQYLASVPTCTKTPSKIDIFADSTPELMWRWELSSLDFIPNKWHSDVKNARSSRKKLKNHQKAVVRLIHSIFDAIECIKSSKSDSMKQKAFASVSLEEEKVLKYEREEEKNRLINEAKKQKLEDKMKAVEEKQKMAEEKRREKDEQEEAKRKEREQKLEEKERKKKEAAEDKLRKKNEAQAIIQEKVLKQKTMMLSFFKTSPLRKSSNSASDAVSSTLRASCFKIANLNSEEFWSELGNGKNLRKPFPKLSKRARQSRRRRVSIAKVRVFVSSISDNPFEPQVYDEERIITIRNKYKFLSFREDYRPPYHGTWSKTSNCVTGRSPFVKDAFLDYDLDSEAEWEEGDDDEGEDCSETGNEDEEIDDEEGDIANYNYQDGWLAEDDDLDMEEDDYETKELRKKKSIEKGAGQGKIVASTCVIAPIIKCFSRCSNEVNPSLISEQVEGIGIEAANKVMNSLQAEILISSKINLDAFPPSIHEVVKKNESSIASAVPKEMSRDDLITFVKFVHNSTLKSKEMVIEELRNTHKDITSSRKQAARKLDSIANKRFVGNGGGVIWEVKKEVLQYLDLHHLIKVDVHPAADNFIQTTPTNMSNELTSESKDAPKSQKNEQRIKKRVALISIPSTSSNSEALACKVKQNEPLLTVTEAPTSTRNHMSQNNPSENGSDKNEKLAEVTGASTPPKGEDRPCLVSPSEACVKNNTSNSPSLKRKASAAPVSKASANLLAAFLKKKKTV